MVQLSRPFQAILAAVVLLALVWFVALHRPGSTSTGSGSSAGSSAQSGGAPSASRATRHPAGVSHSAGALHHTAASRSTAASHPSKASHRSGASHATGAAVHTAAHTRNTVSHTRTTVHTGAGTAHSVHGAAVHKQHTASRAPGTAHTGAATTLEDPPASATGHATAASPAASVAADLEHGKTVLLLFWNPSASNDATVHQQVGIVAHKLGRSVAAFSARASQVGQFGSITRDVQVYQTPTLLIVNPKRQVTTVTGLTDAYALEQTIREARG